MRVQGRSGLRVCIVTPGQIGSNPRVVKEADALREAGREVNVIATRALDLVEPRDQALMRRIQWRLERIDLRSPLRWTLRRAAQVCARQAYAAIGLARSADAGLSVVMQPLRSAALGVPADLYIAHYPAALPAVAAAARMHGALYAYDAEDFHPGDWPDVSAYDTERRLVRAIEGRYLPGCAYVTAASPGIAEAYAEAYGIAAPRVVLNTFPLAHSARAPTPRGSKQPGPSLYWFSQTIGPDRGLECAVRAIGLARAQPHLYLRGTLAAGFAARLMDLAAEAGAPGRVHLLPPAEPDRMEALAAAYDAGLCSETGHTASRRLCLTNKLFSFLLAGIPPLLSDTPAQCRFADEAGLTDLLYPRDDPAALGQLLDALLSDPAPLAAARARAWRLGQERYNWEMERSNLIACLPSKPVPRHGQLALQMPARWG
jgi:glycosyltransferase involved in cell wall biosynthesis